MKYGSLILAVLLTGLILGGCSTADTSTPTAVPPTEAPPPTDVPEPPPAPAAELGFGNEAGYEAAARAVATAMMGVGFGIEAQPGGHRLVTRHCPFGATADAHPDIVCRLDQGMVSGLLERTNQHSLVIVTPHSEEDDACLTEI